MTLQSFIKYIDYERLTKCVRFFAVPNCDSEAFIKIYIYFVSSALFLNQTTLYESGTIYVFRLNEGYKGDTDIIRVMLEK